MKKNLHKKHSIAPLLMLLLFSILGLFAISIVSQQSTENRSAAAGPQDCRNLGATCTLLRKCQAEGGRVIEDTACPGKNVCCTFVPVTPTPVSTQNKRVFLTSVQYNGNLGGVVGADAKCQARADLANLGGTWKAWISDSQTSADARITHTTGNYVLLDGSIVAQGWDDLTDGTIETAININEFGGSPNYASCVWTSTRADGSIYPPYANLTLCDDYTTADENYSMCGHNGVTGYEWTEWSTDQCQSENPLFCFEQ